LGLKKTKVSEWQLKVAGCQLSSKLESDKHRGLSIDYLSRIKDLFQINFIVVNYIENIDPEKADIISGVSGNNLKSTKFHLLNQPFLSFPFAIYTNKYIDKKTQISTLEDLKFSRVAVFKNGPLRQKLSENYPKMKLVYVDIADEAFDELKSGTVDAYVGNEMVLDYYINIHRLKFVEKSGLTPFTSAISMAVRNDQPELASIMEKGILAIGQNNKELLDNWKSTDSKSDQILTAVLGGISVIFLLVCV